VDRRPAVRRKNQPGRKIDEQLSRRESFSDLSVLHRCRQLLICPLPLPSSDTKHGVQTFESLLAPYLAQPLSPDQLKQLEIYLELLLKWNARINLTAVRDPCEIVRRHFGESLFAGGQLRVEAASTLIDLGSGAGFPGLPIKILAPQLQVTLIESQHKKVAFLREGIRALGLLNVSVYEGRAEQSQLKSQIVTMRAVEKFESALSVAASLVQAGGRLALLIGAAQERPARTALSKLAWQEPIAIPESRERVLLIGRA
jgi:16S rRNA (guanine527-N7)-methyltransferase